MIYEPNFRLVAAMGNHLIEPMVPGMELYAAQAEIWFARQALGAGQLIIEGDSTMMVAWLQSYIKERAIHPLLHDVVTLLGGCSNLTIGHIFWEINTMVDWVAAYIANTRMKLFGLRPRQQLGHFEIYFF